ncbi:Sepiapterin reductase [Planctomycetes bacterium CA13]|uniref:Sepiapterin reductase n=1 Tax=Novipirellula herctigrandis TaxID=2527986 RepID=A0A5C5Z0V9_9BACT|nr:Sepiapterin reductase [Planctomycetes bacterium CA13]
MKRILLTGATDGIGLETARMLVSLGHHVLLHGRSVSKLQKVEQLLTALSAGAPIESYVADLSRMSEVESLATAVSEKHRNLDVLINNAGVYVAPDPITPDGLDVRFAVNTIAPWLLTQRLLPLLSKTGRVINLSSAAQAPVDMDALTGKRRLAEGEAYAQSKLALTMWSRELATSLGDDAPAIIAVNPGSLLASKMVKQAFGIAGKDVRIGAEILTRAALDDEFASASGQYFDNDSGQLASPHPDARDPIKTRNITQAIKAFLADTQKP